MGWTFQRSNPCEEEFSASVQTGLGALPASRKVGPGLSRGPNLQGEVLTIYAHLAPRFANGYKLYLRYIFIAGEACHGVTFIFTYLECMTIVGDIMCLPKQSSRNSLHVISHWKSFLLVSSSILWPLFCFRNMYFVRCKVVWNQQEVTPRPLFLSAFRHMWSFSFLLPYPEYIKRLY
jgi:hypothetical protein